MHTCNSVEEHFIEHLKEHLNEPFHVFTSTCSQRTISANNWFQSNSPLPASVLPSSSSDSPYVSSHPSNALTRRCTSCRGTRVSRVNSGTKTPSSMTTPKDKTQPRLTVAPFLTTTPSHTIARSIVAFSPTVTLFHKCEP